MGALESDTASSLYTATSSLMADINNSLNKTVSIIMSGCTLGRGRWLPILYLTCDLYTHPSVNTTSKAGLPVWAAVLNPYSVSPPPRLRLHSLHFHFATSLVPPFGHSWVGFASFMLPPLALGCRGRYFADYLLCSVSPTLKSHFRKIGTAAVSPSFPPELHWNPQVRPSRATLARVNRCRYLLNQ